MRIFIGLMIILWHINACYAEQTSFTVNIDAYTAPVSINAFMSDWHDPLETGNHAYLHSIAELSTENKQRKISIFWRYDYTLNFDEQIVRLFHALANDEPINANIAYPLYGKAHYSESYGIKWQQLFDMRKDITVGLGLSLLKGSKLIEGQLSGTTSLQRMSSKTVSVNYTNLDIDYYYDKPRLYEDQLDWYPEKPSALGFSIDVLFKWHISPILTFDLNIQDLYGNLYWKNVPRTQYQISCQCVNFQHNLAGQLSIDEKYTQRLSPHGTVQLTYQSPQHWLLKFNAAKDSQMTLVQGAWGYQHSTWQSLLLIEPQTHAVGVELRHPNWHLRWLTDDLNTNKAHRMGLSLGVNQQW